MRAVLASFAMWFLIGPATGGPTNLPAKLQSNLRLNIPEAGVTLAGELALPPGPGPHPAVVMVGGLDGGSRALLEAWAESLGVNPHTAAKLVAFQRELFQKILAAKDDADATQRALKTTTDHLAQFTAEERTQLGLTDAQSDVFVKQAGDAKYRQFLAYDPRPVFRRVRCPVLALHGSADRQVSAAENLASVATELRSSGNPQFKALELPGLDHELVIQSTNSPPNVPPGGGAFSSAALRLISEWITEQTKR